jgi:RNA polymerase sigma-70 factor, ECF subfamily
MSTVSTTPSDEQLMVGVQREDRSAYEQLYVRYSGRVFGFLCRRTGAREQADEAHQETWLRVYRWRQRFDPDRNFGSWLFAIAANAGRDAARPRPREFQLPLMQGERQDLRDQLISVLHSLEPKDRRLILLVAEGFTADQVGAMVGMKGPAVRKRVSRARQQLREVCHVS